MRIGPYLELMKLRVVELLLISTLPAMVLAQRGLPSLSLTLATLVGGTLAAGSANAFNMIIEAESDQLMSRTSKRPIASGELTKRQAAIFATAIGVLAVVIFYFFTNILATVLTVIAFLYYVFVYTIALKKTTDQNIVWGGAAGCMPALIGWAAVANSLSLVAWLWFFVIFFWTPPHFWALAIKYKEDYARAGVPMLPVVAPMRTVVWQMWMHTAFMVLTSYALLYSIDAAPWVYLLGTLTNGFFLIKMLGMRGDVAKVERAAIRVFHDSITYLTLFSAVLVLTVFI